MVLQRSILANYVELVLKVARVVLVLLATVAFVSIIGALIWLVFLWTKPTSADYKSILVVPPYEPIASEWLPRLSTEARKVETAARLPPVFIETLEIVDSLYQLVGREEPKFSEHEEIANYYSSLVEPFGVLGTQNNVTIDFLIELKSYARSMTNDELLKRIADVEERTQTILDSIFEFRDQYVTNLRVALATADELTDKNLSHRMVTSSFVLQVLCVCLVAFVGSAICLFGFQLATQKQGHIASTVTPIERNEEN